MDGDKIEQHVTISDNAQTGNITLIGKIENIYNIIKQPSIWQEAFWNFLSRHRYFIGVWLSLETALGATYSHYKNLHLIPFAGWALVAVLFTIALWNIYVWFQYQHSRLSAVLALAAAMPFLAIVGWQTTQIAFPQKFEPQVFTIAVAELGEGPDAQSTAKTREISNQVYEHLCLAVRDAVIDGANSDPCAEQTRASDPPPAFMVRRIGVIPDSKTAQHYGGQIGADVVIWGHLIQSEVGEATIRFQVLENFDRAVNPEFPIVLPVTVQFTEVVVKEIDLNGNAIELKKIIANQSTIISAFALGLSSYLDRDFLQAAAHFEKASDVIDRNPALSVSSEGKSLLYFYLGRSNYAVAQFEQGHTWLRLGQAANPQEPAIPLSLAIGYHSQGLEEEKQKQLSLALKLVNRRLESLPNDNVATYDRGLINQMLEQYEYAILDYQAALERDPNFYIAYISLSQSASSLGEYDQAEDALQDAIALADRSGTNSVWAHLNLALVYEKAGNPQAAKAEFQEAITAEPRLDSLYMYYAQFLENQQEMDAALEAYDTMLDVTWDKGWGHSSLAGFLKRRGLLDQALEHYERAVFYKRDNSLLRTYLAETYAALNVSEKARIEFEEALSLPGNSYYSYASYAKFLFEQGEFQKAAEMYEAALLRRPADYPVLLNLGQTYEILGENERALEVYRRLISLKGQFPEDVIHIAEERIEALGGSKP
jgi:tetratricopeptide (TPR) repeat protein